MAPSYTHRPVGGAEAPHRTNYLQIIRLEMNLHLMSECESRLFLTSSSLDLDAFNRTPCVTHFSHIGSSSIRYRLQRQRVSPPLMYCHTFASPMGCDKDTAQAGRQAALSPDYQAEYLLPCRGGNT